MTDNSERMAVNAAIEKLIAQDDEDGEAARVVIEYGDSLQTSGRIQISRSRHTKSSGSEVSGYSPGHGKVTVKDEGKEEHTEWDFGVHKDRVGYFRLWKEQNGLLRFHHFWKSGITTASMTQLPDVYHLGYEPESLEPNYLGIERKSTILKFWLGVTIEVHKTYLEPLYGTVPKLRQVGLTIYG